MIDTSFFNEDEKEYITSEKNDTIALECMIVLFVISLIINFFFAFIIFG